MRIAKTYRLLLTAAFAAGSLCLMRPAAAMDTMYVDDGVVTGKEGAPGTGPETGTLSVPVGEDASIKGDLAAVSASSGDMAASDTRMVQIQADIAAAERTRMEAEEHKTQTAKPEAQTRLLELQKERVSNEKKAQKKLEEDKRKAEKEQKKMLKKARFQEIGRDKDYVYYMDVKSARYVQPSRSTSERVMDVWVKLVEQPVDSGANPDALTDHYYLEHYYVSTQRKAIQFLVTLEVAGRPQNAVRDRAYRVEQWESLVPGSVEETIYYGAVAKMREVTKFGGRGSTPSLRDMIEEYFRISL